MSAVFKPADVQGNILRGYRKPRVRYLILEVADRAAARRWLAEVFEATVAAVPRQLRGRLDPAELFHQVLDHRWYLSEAAGHDVGLPDAVASFIATVLPGGVTPSGPGER